MYARNILPELSSNSIKAKCIKCIKFSDGNSILEIKFLFSKSVSHTLNLSHVLMVKKDVVLFSNPCNL